MGISNLNQGIRPGVCTSTTRPTTPYEGQLIYETDTGSMYVWNGVDWIDIMGTTPSAYRNVLLNGSFQIWQRSTVGTYTNTDNYLAADRWRGRTSSSGGYFFMTRSTLNLIPQVQYTCALTRNSGNTDTNALQIIQTLESSNSAPLRGQTITLSFYAVSGVGFTPTNRTIRCIVRSGTGTDQYWLSFTGATDVINNTVSLGTTTMVRYQFTGTVPNNSNQLAVIFEWVPTGTAPSDDRWWITGVQLERGNKATPLEVRSFGEELSLCQRYCQVYSSLPVNVGADDDYAVNHASFSFPVMRTAPTAPTTSITFEGHGVFTPTFSIGNGSIRLDTSGSGYRSIGSRGIINGLSLFSEL